jgi:regulatory protein
MARSLRKSLPLDGVRLEEIALAYAARYETTQAKLEAYLRRKLYERGWGGEGDPPVNDIAARFADAGYVDDAAFARARTGSLLRRGYGMRRVGQALAAAGIDKELREELRPDEARQRKAALALARKRRFGPFGTQRPDAALRQKQLAAMLRAGHSFDQARALVDAPDIDAAEQWAEEACGGSEWD